MTASSERRKAELAVIEEARYNANQMKTFSPGGVGLLSRERELIAAVEALDALPLEPATKARVGGPLLTSANAAAFVDGARASSAAGKILQALDERPRTTEELCAHLNGKHQTISARVHELWRNGWIWGAGERATTSGQTASVWRITSEAREALIEGRRAEIEREWGEYGHLIESEGDTDDG